MGFFYEIRYCLRSYMRDPVYGLTVLIVLTVGIASNLSVFSLVNAVLIRHLPYGNSEHLFWIYDRNPSQGIEKEILSPADFQDLAENLTSFSTVAACHGARAVLSDKSAGPEQLWAELGTWNLLDVLEVNPTVGHRFSGPIKSAGKSEEVALISYALWSRRYRSNSDILGKTISVNEKPYTIIGVMPKQFQFPPHEFYRADIWIPHTFDAAELSDRSDRSVLVFGRLKQGISLGDAAIELQHISKHLQSIYPDTNNGWTAFPLSIERETVEDSRSALLLLWGAVGLLFVITCVNVGTLMLVRLIGRWKDVTIRLSLGARRSHLIRSLLTENLAVCLIAGGLGLGLSLGILKAFSVLIPADIPRADETSVDWTLVAFAIGLSFTSALFTSMVSMLATRRDDVSQALKSGVAAFALPRHRRSLTNVAVVSEFMLSCLLLVSAFLLVNSFLRVTTVEPGFKTVDDMVVKLSLLPKRYDNKDKVLGFYKAAMDKIGALPQIDKATLVLSLPLSKRRLATIFNLHDQEGPRQDGGFFGQYNAVSSRYFDALGIPLLQGRYFRDSDVSSSQPVIIVSRKMAESFWPNQNPLGKSLKIGPLGYKSPWRTVVGVVGDVKQVELTGPTLPMFYMPYGQLTDEWIFSQLRNQAFIVAKGRHDTANITPFLRTAVQEIDPDLPVPEPVKMEDVLAESTQQFRFRASLVGSFAGIAVLLSSIGLFGVVSYSLSRRTNEIAIRVALGAQKADVVRMVMIEGCKLIVFGIILGIATSILSANLLKAYLYGVSYGNVDSYVEAVLLLGITGITACYIPVRAAVRSSVLEALRLK